MDVTEYESSLESDVELYDTDRVALNGALQKIQASVGTRQNLEDFRQRIVGMLWDIGFKSDVRVFEGFMENDPSRDTMYFFKIVLNGRVTVEKEYDHDRQQHEVIHDVLGIKDHDGPKKTSVSMNSSAVRNAMTNGAQAARTASGLYLPGK